MYLMYADESGNTGIDYDSKTQPYFILAGFLVKDENWRDANDYFEEEKVKIYPEFKENEIHTCELFNSNKRSIYNKYSWESNLNALERLVDLILSCKLKLKYVCLSKKSVKKHLLERFHGDIKIDPHVYSFPLLYDSFDSFLKSANTQGIIFSDEINNLHGYIEELYPKLNYEHKNIIEHSFYLKSEKSNFIQIADLCALYINKFHCIVDEGIKYNDIKTEHCLKMYDKLSRIFEGDGKFLTMKEQNTLDLLF